MDAHQNHEKDSQDGMVDVTDANSSLPIEFGSHPPGLRDLPAVAFDTDAFPTPRAPPSGLPLRPPPQAPIFAKLDAALEPMPLYASPQTNLEENGTLATSLVRLNKHIKAHLPYVHLASQRLQAVSGVQNDNVFDLPEVSKRPSPTAIRRALPSLNLPSVATAGKPSGNGASDTQVHRTIRRQDSGLGLNGLSTQTPRGFANVDKETGKGLREFLLARGKEHGFRKRECMSISIHDLTPCIRTNQGTNKLLAYYDRNGPNNRVDVYEVDLPSTATNFETGVESSCIETWLWVLIQRPVLQIDKDSTVGYVKDRGNLQTNREVTPTPPPNFPYPGAPSSNPLSWVVFAAPLAHLTVYPESTESQEEFYPLLKKFKTCPSGTRIQKRLDYDFSHSGTPLFEFSSRDLFKTTNPVPFLSVDKIRPFSVNDSYEPFTEERFGFVQEEFQNHCFKPHYVAQMKVVDHEGLKSKGSENGGLGSPSLYNGVWWDAFFTEMYKDARYWWEIQQAMARGKCRIVLRWSEWQKDEVEDEEIDKLMENQLAADSSCGSRVVPNLIETPLATLPRKTRSKRQETKGRSSAGLGDNTMPTAPRKPSRLLLVKKSDMDKPMAKKKRCS